MEDILKRLLEAEKKAEEQVEQADAARSFSPTAPTTTGSTSEPTT